MGAGGEDYGADGGREGGGSFEVHVVAARENALLAGGAGRRKLDRRVDWALSSLDAESGDSDRRIMAEVQAVSMVGGTIPLDQTAES